jgi:hypothetical protein
MATFNKFNQFVGDLGLGVHNLNTGVLKIALTNTAPSATDATLSQITQITGGNGYTTGGATVPSTAYSQTTGTGTLTGSDVVFTATGTTPSFRYAVLYNDTPTSPADPLIGFWDYGSSIALANGETFTVDIGSSILQLT